VGNVLVTYKMWVMYL